MSDYTSRRFVIHKTSRRPDGDYGSYSGPTWDFAGLRDRYQAFYVSRNEAEELAGYLTIYNPVGFLVSKIETYPQC